jgi:GIY-YIG catalytic domain
MKPPTVWTIYCHTHVESGRRYVGQTQRTQKKRWVGHLSAAKSSGRRSHFSNAIRTYGPDAFEHEVLETCVTQEAANEAEIRWISKLGTRDPRFGFNGRDGGKHGPHYITRNPWDRQAFRAHMLEILGSPDRRTRTSEVNREVKSTPDARAKVSAESRARWVDPIIRAKNIAASSAGLRAAHQARPEIAVVMGRSIAAKAAKKRAERTHFECKKHGPIPLADCTSKVSSHTGYVVYSCRECKSAYNKEYQKALKARKAQQCTPPSPT